jgi:aminoglycoside 3-N-acetyltransferase
MQNLSSIDQCHQICSALKNLGLPNGASVMVHSSLRSFGWVNGGAQTVIEALLHSVGPQGNVLMPTLTGSPALNAANPPRFDVRTTPCWTGRIPETFRQMPDALRSLHPTHSVAIIGPQKHNLTRDHQLSPTPCGKETPYYRLAERDGYVLLFGVDLECVTLFHTVEELAGVPYHMQPALVDAVVIDWEGNEKTYRIGIHQYGTPRNFSIMEPRLKDAGVLKKGRVLESTTRLIRARPLVGLTLDALRHDPLLLVKKQ